MFGITSNTLVRSSRSHPWHGWRRRRSRSAAPRSRCRSRAPPRRLLLQTAWRTAMPPLTGVSRKRLRRSVLSFQIRRLRRLAGRVVSPISVSHRRRRVLTDTPSVFSHGRSIREFSHGRSFGENTDTPSTQLRMASEARVESVLAPESTQALKPPTTEHYLISASIQQRLSHQQCLQQRRLSASRCLQQSPTTEHATPSS